MHKSAKLQVFTRSRAKPSGPFNVLANERSEADLRVSSPPDFRTVGKYGYRAKKERAQRPSSKRQVDSDLKNVAEPAINKVTASSKVTTASSKNQLLQRPTEVKLTRITDDTFSLGQISQNEQAYKRRQEEIVKRIQSNMMKSEQIEQGTFASKLLIGIGQRISQPPTKHVGTSQVQQKLHQETEIGQIMTTMNNDSPR